MSYVVVDPKPCREWECTASEDGESFGRSCGEGTRLPYTSGPAENFCLWHTSPRSSRRQPFLQTVCGPAEDLLWNALSGMIGPEVGGCHAHLGYVTGGLNGERFPCGIRVAEETEILEEEAVSGMEPQHWWPFAYPVGQSKRQQSTLYLTISSGAQTSYVCMYWQTPGCLLLPNVVASKGEGRSAGAIEAPEEREAIRRVSQRYEAASLGAICPPCRANTIQQPTPSLVVSSAAYSSGLRLKWQWQSPYMLPLCPTQIDAMRSSDRKLCQVKWAILGCVRASHGSGEQ